MENQLNRRQAVAGMVGAGVFGATLNRGVHSSEKSDRPRLGPNDRPRLAHIGCGGMGMANARHLLGINRSDCLALCDVDESRVNTWAKTIGDRQKRRPDVYGDFRKVLERKDIDAVWISTPDHWHALIAIHACMAGKDVFVEKPVSHNIIEGRMMVNAARKYKRVMQAGTQQRSCLHLQEACKHLSDGLLGKVGLCKAWVTARHPNLGRPKDTAPPAGVDYNMWLGPAPLRDFNKNRFHYNWRWHWDYAGGKCADWGIHLLDMFHLGLGVDAPLAVASVGTRNMVDDNCTTPDTQIAVFEYPGFTCTWEHREFNAHYTEGMRYGMLCYGAKGTMQMDRERYTVVSEKSAIPNPPKKQEKRYTRMYVAHANNFLDCIISRERPRSDIENAHRTTTALHLANIAARVKRRIVWDREKEEIVGDKQASALLGREYRKPWELPSF